MHLQVLERDTGARVLPAVPEGVQLQAVSNQLPGHSHGGEGPGHHLRNLHPEPTCEFAAFSIATTTAGLTMINYTSGHGSLRVLLTVRQS